MSEQIRIPISGGPHAGKTTLINALREVYSGAHFLEEPAERVIARELERETAEPGYEAIVPWRDYPQFSQLVLQEALDLEASARYGAVLRFQDRSLHDNIGYDRLNGVDTSPDTHRYAAVAGYTVALFCHPVGSYTTTEIRRESAEQARHIHNTLYETYRASGLVVVDLPAVSVQERIEIVQQVVGDVLDSRG